MSIIGSYNLHLYCCCESCRREGGSMRRFEHGIAEYGMDNTEARAIRTAKTAGWRIDRKGNRAWAPGHVKRKTDTPALG